jgi:hypothetical protein
MGENPNLEAQEKPSPRGEGPKEGFFEPLLERWKRREDRKTKKVQQIIWLEPKTFARVLELAETLGLAANQTIELIVEDYIARGGDLTKAVEKVKEVIKCPECGQDFESVSQLFEHLKNKSDEARNLVYKLLDLRK